MVAETPSKLTRPIPFTPKRPISSVSGSSTDLSSRLSRLTTPGILSSTHKKYKAPLSSESRSRILPKAKPVLPTVPGTPANTSTSSDARPRTPGTPGRKSATDSPLLMPSTSEMDVSHIDPEEVLVDFQTVEPGDISGEMDEAWLRAADLDHGKDDKVMVSIRYVYEALCSLCYTKHMDRISEFAQPVAFLLGNPSPQLTPSSWTPHMPRILLWQPRPRSILTLSLLGRRISLSITLLPAPMSTRLWMGSTQSSLRMARQHPGKPLRSAVTKTNLV